MLGSPFNLTLAMGAALLLSEAVSAMPIYQAHRCDDCSTTEQMQEVAIQYGLGTRYVFSVTRAEIRKFHVERWCEDHLAAAPHDSQVLDERPKDQATCVRWQFIAVEETVESELTEFVYRMREAYEAYGNSFYGYETVHITEIEEFIKRSEKGNEDESAAAPPSQSRSSR